MSLDALNVETSSTRSISPAMFKAVGKKGMGRWVYKSQDRSKRGALLHRRQRDTNGAKSIDDNDGYEVLFMASIY